VELAKELGLLYTNFINSLDLTLELKNKLIKDLYSAEPLYSIMAYSNN